MASGIYNKQTNANTPVHTQKGKKKNETQPANKPTNRPTSRPTDHSTSQSRRREGGRQFRTQLKHPTRHTNTTPQPTLITCPTSHFPGSDSIASFNLLETLASTPPRGRRSDPPPPAPAPTPAPAHFAKTWQANAAARSQIPVRARTASSCLLQRPYKGERRKEEEEEVEEEVEEEEEEEEKGDESIWSRNQNNTTETK